MTCTIICFCISLTFYLIFQERQDSSEARPKEGIQHRERSSWSKWTLHLVNNHTETIRCYTTSAACSPESLWEKLKGKFTLKQNFHCANLLILSNTRHEDFNCFKSLRYYIQVVIGCCSSSSVINKSEVACLQNVFNCLCVGVLPYTSPRHRRWGMLCGDDQQLHYSAAPSWWP